MSEPVPTVLVPGLIATPRLYAGQLPALWRFGPVMVGDHTRDGSMAAIAARILADAPPRFALVGLSMGGYVAFEILRRAAERVARLALLDTTARPDTPEQTERRRTQIGLAQKGRFAGIIELLYPLMVHPSRRDDAGLRRVFADMAEDTGADAFIRQQTAIMNRADSRPDLGKIRCRTLVLVGDGDEITPPDRAAEMADGIAGARLVTVPQCGHLSTLERPEEVTRTLAEWMEA